MVVFYIRFHPDMKIGLERCDVIPICWIPDIYVNPSNNGNLQSSEYRNPEKCVKRTTREFYALLLEEMKVAAKKRKGKLEK